MSEYNCPCCDKTLTNEDIENQQCSCGLSFKIKKKGSDYKVLREKDLINKLTEEILEEKDSRNCYELFIKTFTGLFYNVAYKRTPRYCVFYLLYESELKTILFRIIPRIKSFYLEFRTKMSRFKNVKPIITKSKGIGHYHSYLETDNFDDAIDIAQHVLETERRKHKC